MFLVLSIIFSAMILIISLNIIFSVPVLGYSPLYFVVATIIAVVYQVAVDGLFAFIVSKLPEKWFKNRKVFNVSKNEQKFYEKLGIRSWKDKIWELGGLGGFSKSKINEPTKLEYIEKFLIESYKGQLDHILGMIAGFSVIFIFPLKLALNLCVPVALVNFILNLLPIMILRYNTPKLLILQKRAVRNLQNENKII